MRSCHPHPSKQKARSPGLFSFVKVWGVPLDQLYGVELDLYTTRQALGWADQSLVALGPADIQPENVYNPDLYTTQP